ncbi:MAG TPA: carboxymuconolactone decarboxylase family protein [bacterium]|nr:carboxymuconolactone decarboxylase family protein [bacterium]
MIHPVEKDQAPDTVKRIYEALEQSLGSVPNFFKMLAHKPDVLRTFNQLYSAVWAEGALSPKMKELAYLRTSIHNGCEY